VQLVQVTKGWTFFHEPFESERESEGEGEMPQMAGLTGVLEDDVQSICMSLIGKPPEDMERAAANVILLARQGADERRALAEEGVIHSLTIMCSREFNAKTQAKGALALAALCSNYSTNLDDTKMYVYSTAQQEALQRGAVISSPVLALRLQPHCSCVCLFLSRVCHRRFREALEATSRLLAVA